MPPFVQGLRVLVVADGVVALGEVVDQLHAAGDVERAGGGGVAVEGVAGCDVGW